MPKLGLGTGFSRSGIVTPGIVTDNLVMKHMYPAGAVQPLSDGAAYFDGSAKININGVKDSLTTEHTMMAWVFRTDTGNGNIFDSDNGNRYRMYIYEDTNTYSYLTWYDGNSVDVTTATTANTMPQMTWSHLCGTFSRTGNFQKLYLNGVEIQTGTTQQDPTVPSSSYHMGNDLGGYMCNAGIWARALTQAEIRSVMWKQYADLTSTETDSLISWYNLDATSIADMDNTNVTIDSVGTLGSELVDNDLVVDDFIAQGTNITSLDDGVFSVQYVDDDDGAKFFFRETGILSTDLVVGSVYRLQLDAKVNTGSANLRISTDTNYVAHEVSNTDWQTFTIYLKSSDINGNFLRQQNLSTAEIMYIKNISFKEVSGNHGTLA